MSLDDIKNERIKKMELLQKAGMASFPSDSRRDRDIAHLLADFARLETEGERATIAGRVMSVRAHGGATFFDLFDGMGRVQCLIKEDEVGVDAYRLFSETIDQGDFLDISGMAFTTKRGEKTLLAKEWRMLTKSVQPIPDEWFGIKDEEERYRKRYLDILSNEAVRDLAKKRSIFWNSARRFLLARDFTEVETPILENKTGGAEARPFITHHNALNIDVYLRISAGELWQKKLMVAGIPKTFEIGRIFRNEGMSHEHLQDYTQLEFYEAYKEYTAGMEMIRELYTTLARETFGTTAFTANGFSFDLAGAWETYDFCAILKERFGIDPLEATLGEVRLALVKVGIPVDEEDTSLPRGIDQLWKAVRKTIGGPGFLINVPVYLEPLAKRSAREPLVVERFQVILAGSEMGKGFSELNDPFDQRARFETQQALREAGDEEAQMADMDFVEALEYGMPPTFGFGVSERLFATLNGTSIRESQLFPLLRPR